MSLLWTETDDVLSERLVKKGDKDKQARKAFVVELRLVPIEAKHTQKKGYDRFAPCFEERQSGRCFACGIASMDEDCERIRLRKDVRDDVVGSEEKKAQKKKTAAAGLLKATQEGLGGEKIRERT